MKHLGFTEGATVAIVGRAGSLRAGMNGPAIDACDVVVRVNWLLPLQDRWSHAVGRRTDLLYTSTAHDPRDIEGAAEAAGVRVVKSTHGARKAVCDLVGGDFRVYTPTTGSVAIWDALESGASRVEVYGMDGYRSRVYADDGAEINARAVYRAEKARGKQTHDLDTELEILRHWWRDSLRFVPDQALRSVLAG